MIEWRMLLHVLLVKRRSLSIVLQRVMREVEGRGVSVSDRSSMGVALSMRLSERGSADLDVVPVHASSSLRYTKCRGGIQSVRAIYDDEAMKATIYSASLERWIVRQSTLQRDN
jgi:hypothetical protein